MKTYHVIISGATGGIGSEIAKCAIENDKVTECTLIYRDENKFNSIFHNEDMSKINKISVDMGIKSTERFQLCHPNSEYTDIRLVLAMSTILPINRISSLNASDISANINLNLISQINLISSIVCETNHCEKKLGIINLNSGAAYRPLNGWSLYSGAKAYLNIFLRTLKSENPNIDVVSYDPGVVDTRMQSDIRSVSREIFDDVEIFRAYQRDGLLNPPSLVATDIFNRYILNWNANDFEEKYSCV